MLLFRHFTRKYTKKDAYYMLSDKRKAEIETCAETILTRNNLQTPGFDLAKFLTETEGFLVGEQSMDDGTTGLLLVNDREKICGMNGHKLIATDSSLQNEENYKARRRYITAHEYGHYILHKQDSQLFAHRDVIHQDSLQEQEADYFARCLLMPKNLVASVLTAEMAKSLNNEEKISMIARVFNVTPKKAALRLQKDLSVI